MPLSSIAAALLAAADSCGPAPPESRREEKLLRDVRIDDLAAFDGTLMLFLVSSFLPFDCLVESQLSATALTRAVSAAGLPTDKIVLFRFGNLLGVG
jgi:hypothetical protein